MQPTGDVARVLRAQGLMGEGALSDDDLWRSSDSSDDDEEEGAVVRTPAPSRSSGGGGAGGGGGGARARAPGLVADVGALAPTSASDGGDVDWDSLVASLLGDGTMSIPPAAVPGESHRKKWHARHAHAWAVTEHVPLAVLDEAERGRPPAMRFPFRLDVFQASALYVCVLCVCVCVCVCVYVCVCVCVCVCHRRRR